ncbi:TetR/AcrR family transcriptional regulator [Streptomyces sp. NPDC059631]|uniref:TetR/AcrR family transcriptional regulator n=1 Tax=Streptomyces sp. NPDC059631 TaxID=3346890 RepID=UPI0036950105
MAPRLRSKVFDCERHHPRRSEHPGKDHRGCGLPHPEVGWGGVTSRGVAERAGVNTGVIHYHVGSISELRRIAATGRIRTFFLDHIDEALSQQDPAVAVERILRSLCTSDAHDPELLLLYESLVAANRDEQLRASIAASLSQLRQRLHDWFAEQGVAHPLAAAVSVTAAMDGFLLQRTLDPDLDPAPPSSRASRLWSNADRVTCEHPTADTRSGRGSMTYPRGSLPVETIWRAAGLSGDVGGGECGVPRADPPGPGRRSGRAAALHESDAHVPAALQQCGARRHMSSCFSGSGLFFSVPHTPRAPSRGCRTPRAPGHPGGGGLCPARMQVLHRHVPLRDGGLRPRSRQRVSRSCPFADARLDAGVAAASSPRESTR